MAFTSFPNVRVPGRFPSPTPSVTLSQDDASRAFIPAPRTPIAQIKNSLYTAATSRIDYTASATARQFPIFSGPQSNRPRVDRRAVSDPRHDRLQSRQGQNYGSPMRKARRDRPLILKDRRSRANPEQINSTTKQPESFSQSTASLPNISIGTISTAPMTAQEVQDELCKRLCNKITPKSETGVVYVLRDPDRRNLLKIGHSKHLRQRMLQIERTCGIQLEVVYISNRFENYPRAERLAHGDLRPSRREHQCRKCEQSHGEWFEVSEEMAVRTVKRWVDFINQGQPYAASGKLKDFWKHLIFTRCSAIPSGGKFDHDARWEHWTNIIRSPSIMDYSQYASMQLKNHRIWSHICEFPWQMLSLLSVAIICHLTRYNLIFGGLWIALACTHFTSSVELRKVH